MSVTVTTQWAEKSGGRFGSQNLVVRTSAPAPLASADKVHLLFLTGDLRFSRSPSFFDLIREGIQVRRQAAKEITLRMVGGKIADELELQRICPKLFELLTNKRDRTANP
jgi:hypothetical protein